MAKRRTTQKGVAKTRKARSYGDKVRSGKQMYGPCGPGRYDGGRR